MKFIRRKATLAVLITLALILSILPITSLFSPVQAAPWAKYIGEVTLDGELFVTDAWVLKEGATYKMWYTHSRSDMDIPAMANNLTTIISSDLLSDFVNLDLDGLLSGMANIADTEMDALWDFMTGTTTVIGYAESSDGIDWSVMNDEVLAGTSGTLESVGNPCVINDGGEYKMWFTHSVTSLDKPGLQAILQDLDDLTQTVVRDALIALIDSTESAIGYASSVDETSWSTPSFEVFSVDAGGLLESVSTPCVINEGGTYKTWYTYTETDITATDITDILSDIGNFGVADIMDVLGDTKSTIGYTTSSTSTSVDIGSSAQNYDASVIMDDFTIIDRNNPASASGIIDTVELWASGAFPNLTGVKVGAFYLESGNILSARGNPAYIGDVTAGSKQTFTGLSIPVQEGDYIGLYATDTGPETRIEGSIISGDGYWFKIGDYTNSQNISYLPTTNRKLAIGGYSTTWEAGHTEVLAGSGGGVWDSVSTPCVINNGSDYEMWFTYTETDLTQTEIENIFVELQAMETDIINFWGSYDSLDLDPFLNNFTDLIDTNANMQNIKALLSNTGNNIGYTTSTDGTTWDPETEALTGSGGPWGSVGAPCVVLDSGTYEMWFTQGIDGLTSQNIIELMDGSDLPIGYATFGVDIDLVTGWNFIGLPLSPVPADTADVLSDILANVQTVWAYDAATATWDYYTTLIGPPQGNLLQMDVGVGYWVELTSPATLIVSGTEPTYPYDIDLVIGWNLISIPKTPNPSTTADVLSGIITNVQTVWNYDATTATWDYYTTIVGPPQGDLTDMTENEAYWIEMTAADTLTIN